MLVSMEVASGGRASSSPAPPARGSFGRSTSVGCRARAARCLCTPCTHQQYHTRPRTDACSSWRRCHSSAASACSAATAASAVADCHTCSACCCSRRSWWCSAACCCSRVCCRATLAACHAQSRRRPCASHRECCRACSPPALSLRRSVCCSQVLQQQVSPTAHNVASHCQRGGQQTQARRPRSTTHKAARCHTSHTHMRSPQRCPQLHQLPQLPTPLPRQRSRYATPG